MKHFYLFAIAALLGSGCITRPNQSPDYPISPIDFADVRLSEGFWADRLETNRTVTIPHIFSKNEETGRLSNMRRAAGIEQGAFCTTYPFDDTDIYKSIEAASHSLRRTYDADLDAFLDDLIATIGDAQEEDGYLYTFGVLTPDTDERAEAKEWWYGQERWQKVHLHSHELYNAGHLYEAAFAHYQATGKRSLLDIALKNADLIVDTFGRGPDQLKNIPGHQVIEMGLAKLYRATGDAKYLDQANFFLGGRGDPLFGQEGGEYWQNHIPAKQQTEAVGHAVRAAYMYSGMADVGVLADDPGYINAIDRIWEDVVGKKLYVTGGIGSTGEGEGFKEAYELPNMTAYNETCAAIANALWNHRLFLIHGDAKYMDVFERTLYNNLIAGVSLEGDTFFYPNPLESDGDYGRSAWFGCSCCPPNVARFLPQVPGFAYAVDDQTVYVNLYMESQADLEVGGDVVSLRQETRYPWEGDVRMVVSVRAAKTFSLKVRIPGWAVDRPVPSDLYRYRESAFEQPTIKVNGDVVPLEVDHGYVTLSRDWMDGDIVELGLPMPVRKVVANEQVEADRGRIALERGPLVYAAESVDNGPDVRSFRFESESEFEASWEHELLNGITIIKGSALLDGAPRAFTAIPYYAWAHRGRSHMSVWFETLP